MIRVAVAHAAWIPERTKTLARLLAQMPGEGVFISESETREHASVWATRLWRWAVEQDDGVILLNDDVTVHPKLVDVVSAMSNAVPGELFALHCTSPVAPSFAEAGERWLRSYWMTGPGMYLPPGAAKRLLAWIETVPQSFVASINEDNLIMHWAWHEQRPIWHCIPALVQHDTSTRSSLGYDNQPAWMRSSPVAWDAECIPKPRKLPDGIDPMDQEWRARNTERIVRQDCITEPEFWARVPDDLPMLVECPWMVRERLAQVERFLYDKPDLCSFCHRNDGSVASQNTGAKICKVCLVKTVAAAVGGVG